MIRINKYLASCGVTSRRHADELVSAARVAVNDQIITTPGLIINEQSDTVTVDGKAVSPVSVFQYIVLNKPAGYVTSLSDPHHPRTVADLITDIPARVYPVGRLDLDTEGVLLLTNDGEMAHRLAHPRYSVRKLYRAKVAGAMTDVESRRVAAGIKLPDGAIGKAHMVINKAAKDVSEVELTLTEGRKREVKHLCKAVGHPVLYLERLAFAGITVTGLPRGKWRHLTADEVSALKKLVGQ